MGTKGFALKLLQVGELLFLWFVFYGIFLYSEGLYRDWTAVPKRWFFLRRWQGSFTFFCHELETCRFYFPWVGKSRTKNCTRLMEVLLVVSTLFSRFKSSQNAFISYLDRLGPCKRLVISQRKNNCPSLMMVGGTPVPLRISDPQCLWRSSS